MKGILVEVVKDCIELFGNTQMAKYLKGITSIILTAIQKIIGLRIWVFLKKVYTLDLRVKRDLKTTLNLQKNFTQKELKPQRNGTNQKKVENGIVNKVKTDGLTENTELLNVKYATKNLKQDIQESQNIVIQTAKLLHLEEGESYQAETYDLMVEDCHEYFANGVLVHNCIDALRYFIFTNMNGSGYGDYQFI